MLTLLLVSVPLLLLLLSARRVPAEVVKNFNSYCDICQDHTFCKYYGPNPSCYDLVPRPLGPDEQNQVLAAHNVLRWTLALGAEGRGAPGPQPPASNMRLMFYDDELAAVAQRWAEQCHFKHDRCRNVDRFSVGQNIYWEGSSSPLKEPDWEMVTKKWYDEVSMHSGRSTYRPFTFTASTGHFTQLGWADTFLVGCGIAEYSEYRAGRWWRARLYVCNYGPAGNVIGGRLYRTGDACTRCPENSYCYYGLCV